MLVLINAMKSITRTKGRNILIVIIVIAIAAAACVALAIRNAANEAETVGTNLVNITASISVDRQKMMESMQGGMPAGGLPDMSGMREIMTEYQDLSLSELLDYSDSEYVKDFYYSNSISLNATGDLEAYSTESNSDSSNNTENNQGFAGGAGGAGGGRGGSFVFGGFAMGDFTVTGYSAEDAMTKFIDGTAQITDGEMFDVNSSDMNCLISYELAVFNGLSVGDTITLANPSSETDEDGNATETYTFTITGIYTDSSSANAGNVMRFSTSMDPANLICISYGALETVVDNSASVATVETNDNGIEQSTAINGQLSSTFVFSNVEDYESFAAELTEKGLSEYYTLSSTDINNYASSLTPLKNLSEFASTLLYIVLAIGATILVILNVINIRERKYEVGVLTAIGIKKSKVAMQFVTELLCVTLIGIILGAGIGAAVSVPVSNNLLSAQIEQMQTQSANQDMRFGRTEGGGRQNIMQGGGMMDMFAGNNTDVDYLDQINATVNFSILGQLAGIGIVLSLISSLGAVVFVMRYEPLKILANRT